eukprot:6923701-Heterocapsa_arctica.AAC.1
MARKTTRAGKECPSAGLRAEATGRMERPTGHVLQLGGRGGIGALRAHSTHTHTHTQPCAEQRMGIE